MVKPKIVEYEIEDGLNESILICVDRDAEVLSFTVDQRGSAGYLHVTLEGLKALAEAAQRLTEQ